MNGTMRQEMIGMPREQSLKRRRVREIIKRRRGKVLKREVSNRHRFWPLSRGL